MSEVTDVEDVVSLALTCSYFFRLLGPSVQKALKTDAALWAGDRLVLIKSNTMSEPPDLELTAEDVRDIETKLAPESRTLGRRLYKLGGPNYGDHDVFKIRRGALVRTLRRRMHAGPDTKSDVEAADRLVAVLKRKVDNHELVLRCLACKNYIQEATLLKANKNFSLNDVIFSNIRWADVENSSPESVDIRGCWAGTPFDIGTLADVQGVGWADVSAVVVQELQTVADELGWIESDED